MSFVAAAIAIGAGSLVTAGASIYAGNKAASASQHGTDAAVGEQQREYDQSRADTAPYRAAGESALGKLAKLYGLDTGGTAAGDTRKVGSGVFKPSEIVALKNQGYSVDDILKTGILGQGQGSKELRYLAQSGFSADDINRLQTGSFSPLAASGGTSSTPDMSVFTESPDYQFNLAEGQKALDRSLAARGMSLSGAGVREGVRYASGMASNEFGNFYNRLAGIAGIGQTGVGQATSAGVNSANNISNAYMNNGQAQGSAYGNMAGGINNAVQGGIGNYLLMNYLGKKS